MTSSHSSCGTLQVSSALDTSSFEDNVKTVMILLNDEDWRMTEQDSASVTICDWSFWRHVARYVASRTTPIH